MLNVAVVAATPARPSHPTLTAALFHTPRRQKLRKEHGGKFMVWNISEKLYDYEPFENMVLEFKFPGYPSPPLNVLVELMKSIKSWLSADPNNIAVVHCATGSWVQSQLLKMESMFHMLLFDIQCRSKTRTQ